MPASTLPTLLLIELLVLGSRMQYDVIMPRVSWKYSSFTK